MTRTLSNLERVVRRTTDEFGLHADVEFDIHTARYHIRIERQDTLTVRETWLTADDAEGHSDRYEVVDGTVCRMVEELFDAPLKKPKRFSRFSP